MAVDWDRLMAVMVKDIGQFIADRADPLEQRLEALEARLGTVEAKSARYCGVWQRALDYSRGDLATHEGQLWICTADATKDQPGKSHAWQLAAKGGSR